MSQQGLKSIPIGEFLEQEFQQMEEDFPDAAEEEGNNNNQKDNNNNKQNEQN